MRRAFHKIEQKPAAEATWIIVHQAHGDLRFALFSVGPRTAGQAALGSSKATVEE